MENFLSLDNKLIQVESKYRRNNLNSFNRIDLFNNFLLCFIVQADSNHFCIICKASFPSRRDRNDHLETHFVHRNCDYCSKPVLVIGDLEFELHRPTHCKKIEPEIVDDFDGNTVVDTEIEPPTIESIQIEPVIIKDVLYLKTGPKLVQAPTKRSKTVVNYCELDTKVKRKRPVRKQKRSSRNQSTAPLRTEHITIDAGAVDDDHVLYDLPQSKSDGSGSEDKVVKEMDVALKKRRRYPRLPKIVPCTECDSMFGSERTLKIHLSQVHGIKEKLICPICSREFKVSGNLKQHIETHSDHKRFICNYCGKGFHLPYNLKEHMNIHTGAR